MSPCSNVADSLQLTINPLPTASAGADTSICQGTSYNVWGAQVQNTTPFGGPGLKRRAGFLLNSGTIAPTYVPTVSETGVVNLTLTVAGALACMGRTATDIKTLTYNPQPSVEAGVNATICAANTYSVSGTQLYCSVTNWSTSGDGSFNLPNSLNAIYTPGPADILAGSVQLTLHGQGAGACSAESVSDFLVLPLIRCLQ